MEGGRRLDVAWEASGARESAERAWIRTLVYGVARMRGRVDFVLERAGGRRVDELDGEVRLALRMGAYQILEMGGVPSYAAVSEAVRQVRGTKSRAAAGLVNAVLRRVAARSWSEEDFPRPTTGMEAYLASWGSHPRWLVRRWIRAFGPLGARRLVEANNREPVVYLRPLGASVRQAEERLAAAGLGTDARPVHGTIPLPPRTDPAAALALVPGVILDPAASLVADFVAAPPGALVADLCAAPGGKALALAATGARVLAADRSRRRLRRVVEGRERVRRQLRPGSFPAVAGVANPGPGTATADAPGLWTIAADARRPPLARADAVLLDVPCSGTGTLRRHPDGRWRITPETIAGLAAVQRTLLEGAATAVPPGGLLVYATCALEPEENQVRINDFLRRHPDFALEAGPAPKRFLDDRGRLVVLPQDSDFDGAFAARLRRRSA